MKTYMLIAYFCEDNVNEIEVLQKTNEFIKDERGKIDA